MRGGAARTIQDERDRGYGMRKREVGRRVIDVWAVETGQELKWNWRRGGGEGQGRDHSSEHKRERGT